VKVGTVFALTRFNNVNDEKCLFLDGFTAGKKRFYCHRDRRIYKA